MLSIGDFARLGQVSPRMLRHYDEIGLLRPEQVDPASGYRYYGANQLARLHRLLALRDLGFGLDQIGPALDEDLTIDQLRGMLRMRRAQIEASLAEEQARLRRVEAHLRALERSDRMDLRDIVIKQTQPIRIAEATGTAPGFGHENLGPVFDRLLPVVLDHLRRARVRPRISVAHYDPPGEDGTLTVHAGFDIGDQDVPESGDVRVVELPRIQVASVVRRGSIETVVSTYEALARWIEDTGYRTIGRSRELYHERPTEEPERHVTELQMPIAE
ncbi:MAG TPA: MerR family transcriptional regulator [Acidimicrobiales bacterium]|nr:MerR family transcriptional regulator [Acidimicrobiales bacterium]